MHHSSKWKNWPVLMLGLVLIIGLLFISKAFNENKVISTYLADIAGALTAVVISIATYDEWERRQERKRYRPPEEQGLRRIKNEIAQLIFQYEFMLDGRFQEKNASLRIADHSKAHLNRSSLQIKTARQIAESKVETEEWPLKLSTGQLGESRVDKLTYDEADKLVEQIEVTVRRVDASIATYGYSFTPEIHKETLQLREELEQISTGNRGLLAINLAANSTKRSRKLGPAEQDIVRQVIQRLIKIAKRADKLKSL